ncbi:hypothetical protein BAX95_17120 [Elizabethkingia meningoseptica]|uniref:hypothetical protein n=1 Tax=Elizabethkingia meningoseptica TaxID=238 RepID=UPI00099ABE86|nr:hypothetical protein [Elizabethkingia meningoseptica]OPC22299.1 hypothetical protein BAX95_17120 [Elizabethkingia meningoseptica]
MKYLFNYKQALGLPLLIFAGKAKAQAQNIQTNILPAQCIQKLILKSDKMIFTKDHREKLVKSEIIIDPQESIIIFSFEEPGKTKQPKVQNLIRAIKCTIDNSFTTGKVIYAVNTDNPDGSVSATELLLEATPDGLFFSSNIDPANNKVLIPVSKKALPK